MLNNKRSCYRNSHSRAQLPFHNKDIPLWKTSKRGLAILKARCWGRAAVKELSSRLCCGCKQGDLLYFPLLPPFSQGGGGVKPSPTNFFMMHIEKRDLLNQSVIKLNHCRASCTVPPHIMSFHQAGPYPVDLISHTIFHT